MAYDDFSKKKKQGKEKAEVELSIFLVFFFMKSSLGDYISQSKVTASLKA